MAFNFRIAKGVLSENDKDRLVCIYLNRFEAKLDSAVSISKYYYNAAIANTSRLIGIRRPKSSAASLWKA